MTENHQQIQKNSAVPLSGKFQMMLMMQAAIF